MAMKKSLWLSSVISLFLCIPVAFAEENFSSPVKCVNDSTVDNYTLCTHGWWTDTCGTFTKGIYVGKWGVRWIKNDPMCDTAGEASFPVRCSEVTGLKGPHSSSDCIFHGAR